MQCYEQFGWLPKDILALPVGEAELLSIYFEEVAAHQYRTNKEMKSKSGSGGSRTNAREITDLEIGDEAEEEEEWLTAPLQ